MPLKRRIRGLVWLQGLRYFIAFAPAIMATTTIACTTIQTMNCCRRSRTRSWSRLCAGSPMAPKTAIRMAPPQTRMVPPRDHLVKGSPRIRVAHIELKTKPDYPCKRMAPSASIRKNIQPVGLTEPGAAKLLSGWSCRQDC